MVIIEKYLDGSEERTYVPQYLGKTLFFRRPSWKSFYEHFGCGKYRIEFNREEDAKKFIGKQIVGEGIEYHEV